MLVHLPLWVFTLLTAVKTNDRATIQMISRSSDPSARAAALDAADAVSREWTPEELRKIRGDQMGIPS